MADADFNPGSLILGSHSAETTQMWAVRHGNCPGRPQLVRLWGSPDFMGLKRAGCRESAHCGRRHLAPGTLPLLPCDPTCWWRPSCVRPSHVQSVGVGSRGRATGKELLLPLLLGRDTKRVVTSILCRGRCGPLLCTGHERRQESAPMECSEPGTKALV